MKYSPLAAGVSRAGGICCCSELKKERKKQEQMAPLASNLKRGEGKNRESTCCATSVRRTRFLFTLSVIECRHDQHDLEKVGRCHCDDLFVLLHG